MKCAIISGMYLIVLLLAAYLIGSVPTSIIAGKLLCGIDIREHGSRNPGATNTFRVLGKRIGISVGLIDIFKGFFVVWFLARWIPDEGLVHADVRLLAAGIAAILGHVFTVFAGFKGGKGVGTAFGVFLGLAPLPSAICLVVWVALVFGTGYVSVGSIAAAAVLPIAVAVEGMMRSRFSLTITLVSAVAAVLIIVRHRANIGRLMRGEENRFGKKGAT